MTTNPISHLQQALVESQAREAAAIAAIETLSSWLDDIDTARLRDEAQESLMRDRWHADQLVSDWLERQQEAQS